MKSLSKLLFLTFAILTPGLVFAANIFEPTSGDVSIKILNQLFGGLVGTGDGHDAFGKAIETFNGAVLAVGGILAAYTVLAGTLGTAHDGEMLGKKFSSVWIPIRYSVGTALILPISSAGYCGMQMLVMWLITQGVGLADSIWSSYVDSPQAILSSKLQPVTKKQILDFAQNVALAHGCVAAIDNNNKTALDSVLFDSNQVWTYGVSVNNFGANGSISTPNKYSFGKQGGNGDTYISDKCGSANLVTIAQPENSYSVSDLTGSNNGAGGGKLGSFGIAFSIPNTSPIYQAHNQAGKALIDSLSPLAQAASTSKTSISNSEVQKIAETYITSIESAGNAYISGNDPFKDIKSQANTQGWILAGAWYTKLTMLNAQFQKAMNSVPTATGTTEISNSWYGFSDDAVNTLKIVQKNILVNRGTFKEVENNTEETENPKSQETVEGSSWLSEKLASAISSSLSLDVTNLQNDTRPAIIIIQELGDNMINWWQGLMAALMIVSAAGAVPVVGQAVGPFINVVVSFLTIPISALVVTGFTLGYLLPNLPFLMWCGVVLGWVIMTIEAILAAPLWAVMHLHPNGDDLTGRGGNGYMLLLGLVLRPALAIFGLIAALVVTDLMGEFVNKVFFSVFYAGPVIGVKALLIVIFSIGIYTMAQFSMFKKTFSLMHVIPDQLMQWIGGGQSQLGQYAGSVADEAGKGVGAASVAAGFVGDKAVDGIRGGNQAINQLRELKGNKIAQQEGNQIAAIENQSNSENQDDKTYGVGVGAANSDALSVPYASGPKAGQESRPPLQIQKDRLEMKHAQNEIKAAGGNSQDAINYANEVKSYKNSNPGSTNSEAINSVKENFISNVMSKVNNDTSINLGGVETQSTSEIKDTPVPTETK